MPSSYPQYYFTIRIVKNKVLVTDFVPRLNFPTDGWDLEERINTIKNSRSIDMSKLISITNNLN